MTAVKSMANSYLIKEYNKACSHSFAAGPEVGNWTFEVAINGFNITLLVETEVQPGEKPLSPLSWDIRDRQEEEFKLNPCLKCKSRIFTVYMNSQPAYYKIEYRNLTLPPPTEQP